MRTREELAWAAGFFDGEGCFYQGVATRYKGGKRILADVPQSGVTKPDVLVKFQEATGLGKIYGPYRATTRVTPQWQLRVHGFEGVQALVAMLWPWLGEVKREQAKRALAVYHELHGTAISRKTPSSVGEASQDAGILVSR